MSAHCLRTHEKQSTVSPIWAIWGLFFLGGGGGGASGFLSKKVDVRCFRSALAGRRGEHHALRPASFSFLAVELRDVGFRV